MSTGTNGAKTLFLIKTSKGKQDVTQKGESELKTKAHFKEK
jgi:hypothetical protein